MSLLELLFDSFYYKSSHQGMLDIETSDVFNPYKESVLKGECNPPNEYFAQDPDLLYKSVDNSKKKECQLADWLKEDIEEEGQKTLGNYVKYLVILEKSQEQLERLLASSNDVASELITTSFEEQKDHKLSEKTIYYYEGELKKESSSLSPITILSILINYEKKFSETPDHAIFLSEVIKDGKYLGYEGYDIIQQNFKRGFLGSVERGKIFAPEVFENFEKWVPVSKVDEVAKELTEGRQSFMVHGAKHKMYVPSEATVEEFKGLLSKDSTLATDAIFATLESLFDKQEVDLSFILKNFVFILEYGYGLALENNLQSYLKFVNKFIEIFVKSDLGITSKLAPHSNKYSFILSEIVNSRVELPKEELQKLPKPLLRWLAVAETGGNTAAVRDVVFIMTRLFERNIELPEHIAFYFSKYLENEDIQLQRLALNLSHKLGCSSRYVIPAEDGDYSYLFELDVDEGLVLDSEKVKLLAQEDKLVIDKLLYLISEIGWPQKTLLALLDNLDPSNVGHFIKALDRIYSYKISHKLVDHHGNTIVDIFREGTPEKWYADTLRLLDDNEFFLTKEVEVLLQEIEGLNRDTLTDEDITYLKNKLADVKKFDVTKFKEKDDFIRWRATIKEVTHDNIAEVAAVLKHAIHLAKFKGKYHVRDHQILSLLLLFKSANGRLLQVGTGEGKTVIIDMFAAINVFNKEIVDIITSSSKLVEREIDEEKAFYDLLGITVAHNLGANSADGKECYTADIVYGTPLAFIGDVLRDKTTHAKHGRGFGVVIVDEVDNMFIDQIPLRVQKSANMPGFELLRPIYIYIWGRLKVLTSLTIPIGDGERFRYFNASKAEEGQEPEPEWVEVNQPYKEFLKTKLTAYLEEILDYTSSPLEYTKPSKERDIVVPKHLEDFVIKHVERWIDSVIGAVFMYQEDKHYKVYNNTDTIKSGKNTITPIDKNTGDFQNLHWSDGLHEFLEIRHELQLNSESLISTFMTYGGYFLKYKGKIFGLTGTLGEKHHKDYLYDVYGVDSIQMPYFVEKKLQTFSPVIVNNQRDWLKSITEIAKKEAEEYERAVLIIAPTISDLNLVYQAMKAIYPEERIFKYGDGESQKTIKQLLEAGKDPLQSNKDQMQSGSIMIATILAGRGADIKISEKVEKRGGLHVLDTYYPNSLRVDNQIGGRAARNGERGSVQSVINTENPAADSSLCDNIPCLKKAREEQEATDLKKAAVCTIPNHKLEDGLLDEFIKISRQLDSPIGYVIVLSYDKKPEKLQEKTMYVYEENQKVYFVSLWEGKMLTLDITQDLQDIDPTQKIFNHMVSLLTGLDHDLTLSYRDFDLLHFIAAIRGYGVDQKIIARVAIEYELLFDEEESVEEFIDDKLIPVEIKYLKKLISYQDQQNKGDDVTLKRDLEIAKLREFYRLWKEDRNTYSKQYEIAQLQEHFALLLTELSDLLGYGADCDITDEHSIKQEKEKREKRKEELDKRFEEFKAHMLQLINTNELMQNPAYLLQKAHAYHNIKIQNEEKEKKIKARAQARALQQTTTLGEIITASLPDNQDTREFQLQGKYDFLGDMPKTSTEETTSLLRKFYSAVASGASYAISFLRGDTMRVPADGKVPRDRVYIKDPLSEAVSFAETAIARSGKYSWPSHSSMAFLRLMKDGEGIKWIKDTERAMGVNQRFIKDEMAALNALVNTTTPQTQSALVTLLAQGTTHPESDLALPKIVKLKAYQIKAEKVQENIKLVANATSTQVVRIRAIITVEDLAEQNNITTNDTNSLIPQSRDLDLANSSFNLAVNRVIKANLKEFTPLLNEELNSGEVMIEVTLENLLEEPKEWFATFFSVVLGVFQIMVGVALMGAGGPAFIGFLGAGLIGQGIGDIVSAGLAAITGNPIDMDNYIKSKGLGLAITVITAGLGHIAVGLEIIKPLDKLATGEIFSHLRMGLVSDVGVRGMSTVLGGIAGSIYESNSGEVERDVKESIGRLIDAHIKDLIIIFASDDSEKKKSRLKELEEQAHKITSDYSTRFKGEAVTVMTGAISGFLGLLASPKHPNAFATAGGTGMNVALGLIKTLEATNDFRDKFGKFISGVAKGLGTRAMMEQGLTDLGPAFAGKVADIMKVLATNGFVTDKDIQYESCGSIASFNLGSFKDKSSQITGACNNVATLMRQATQQADIDDHKREISNIVFTSLTGIIKPEIIDPLARFAASQAVNKAFELSAAEAAEAARAAKAASLKIPVPTNNNHEYMVFGQPKSSGAPFLQEASNANGNRQAPASIDETGWITRTTANEYKEHAETISKVFNRPVEVYEDYFSLPTVYDESTSSVFTPLKLYRNKLTENWYDAGSLTGFGSIYQAANYQVAVSYSVDGTEGSAANDYVSSSEKPKEKKPQPVVFSEKVTEPERTTLEQYSTLLQKGRSWHDAAKALSKITNRPIEIYEGYSQTPTIYNEGGSSVMLPLKLHYNRLTNLWSYEGMQLLGFDSIYDAVAFRGDYKYKPQDLRKSVDHEIKTNPFGYLKAADDYRVTQEITSAYNVAKAKPRPNPDEQEQEKTQPNVGEEEQKESEANKKNAREKSQEESEEGQSEPDSVVFIKRPKEDPLSYSAGEAFQSLEAAYSKGVDSSGSLSPLEKIIDLIGAFAEEMNKRERFRTDPDKVFEELAELSRGVKEMASAAGERVIDFAEKKCPSCGIKEKIEKTRKAFAEGRGEKATKFFNDNTVNLGVEFFKYINKKYEKSTTEDQREVIDAALVIASLYKMASNAFKPSVVKIGSEVGEGFKHYVELDVGLLKKEMAVLDSQIQMKFKHAGKFGIIGNYNKQNSDLFRQKLIEHVQSSDTIAFAGTHRGTEKVVHFYNPKTGRDVMKGTDGKFISGWELEKGSKQEYYLKTRGNLQ